MKLPPIYTKVKNAVNVVIETPYKSRNKYNYDEETGMFRLSKVLPVGLAFPCDMGFIPHTKAEDGDPLDVLIIMDELTFPGCIIECRLVGVIKASQQAKGAKKAIRNDRIIAVPIAMRDTERIKDISDISKNKIDEIIKFFEYYNSMEGKKFALVEISGHKEPAKLIDKAGL
jgi:inorganic pyrophosphatase